MAWVSVSNRLRTFIWVTLTLGLPQGVFGQAGAPSVLEQLETDSDPIRGKNGKVESDINPSDVIHWQLAGHDFDPATKKLNLTLSLTTERQFTIYEDKLNFEPSAGWKILSKRTPATDEQFDPISQKTVNVYRNGAFDLVLEASGTPEEATLKITYVGCTQVICLFPHTEKISIPWSVNPELSQNSVMTEPPKSNESTDQKTPVATTGDTSSLEVDPKLKGFEEPSHQTLEEQFAQKVKAGDMSLWMLLLIAFVGGILTNLTPCVAPMIPITIRLLAHQTIRPLTSSVMYALGIVATYTTLGVIAALSGALFGNLIAHPAVSITFGVVMFVLGLNMLGFGDLSRLQQLGSQIGSSRGGAVNALLMGAGAGLVASPCTGPILAALLTYTAGRQNTIEAISLLGTYSIGFALPYVFLGASAAKLSKVRVDFRVQILTKLVFASIMFGLSLYFLRIPLYGVFTALRAYWGLIGWIGGLAGIAGSAVIILKANFHHRKDFFLVPTLALGIGLFFGIQSATRSSTNTAAGKIEWYHSEAEAFAAAKAAGKPLIVDAWAEWCEACKKMDVTTFADPNVIAEISERWIALKFDLTEMNDQNSAIQERYELQGLPTLTLLPVTANLAEKKSIAGYSSAPALLESLQKHRDTLARGP